MYKVGDKVRIVNYGHKIWTGVDFSKSTRFKVIKNLEDGTYVLDMRPELVNQVGIIDDILGKSYSVSGIQGKHAWYNEDQLELADTMDKELDRIGGPLFNGYIEQQLEDSLIMPCKTTTISHYLVGGMSGTDRELGGKKWKHI